MDPDATKSSQPVDNFIQLGSYSGSVASVLVLIWVITIIKEHEHAGLLRFLILFIVSLILLAITYYVYTLDRLASAGALNVPQGFQVILRTLFAFFLIGFFFYCIMDFSKNPIPLIVLGLFLFFLVISFITLGRSRPNRWTWMFVLILSAFLILMFPWAMNIDDSVFCAAPGFWKMAKERVTESADALNVWN